MITSVAASVALAMGAVVVSDKHPARLCSANTASNPVCCATIVLGLLGLDCTTREFSLQLGIKGDHLSILPYLQLQAPPHLKISPTSRRSVPPPASKLCAASLESYVKFLLYWSALFSNLIPRE